MRNYIPKLVAFFVGILSFLTVPPVIGLVFGQYTLYPFYFLVLSQGIAGLILALIWPRIGWRLGLWLSAIWPFLLLMMAFLGGEELRWANWKRDASEALTYLWILIAGCVGAWLGAFIARRFRHTKFQTDSR